jgi:hypothetical protein
MPKTNKPKTKPRRRMVPLFVTLPPAERARIVAYSAKVRRPLAWTVRDALAAYLDAVEPRALAVEVDLDPATFGKTTLPKLGRPPRNTESGANVR